jgi:hypothetical protein
MPRVPQRRAERRAGQQIDVSDLTVESALLASFDASIRSQLAHVWHQARPGPAHPPATTCPVRRAPELRTMLA